MVLSCLMRHKDHKFLSQTIKKIDRTYIYWFVNAPNRRELAPVSAVFEVVLLVGFYERLGE